MKRYRVWQANREVFLWPENWLYPELRDDQSPFFQETMSALLQSDITDDAAANAYLDYLTKLEAVAKLEPCGLYYVPASDHKMESSYVIARTAGAHRKYYFRRLESGSWTPWNEAKIDCEDMPITPIVWNGRLFLFWLRILKQPSPQPPPPNSVPTGPVSGSNMLQLQNFGDLSSRAQNKITVRAVLCWSEFCNGKWQHTKSSDINRPTNLGEHDATAFDVDRNLVQIVPREIDTASAAIFPVPPGKLILEIQIQDPIKQTVTSSRGGFLLYNAHSLPVRFDDIYNINNVFGIPAFLCDELAAPHPRRSLAPIKHYTGYADGTMDKPFSIDYWDYWEGLPWIIYFARNKLINLKWTPRYVEPQIDMPWPDIWDAPFFFEDRHSLFYVTTIRSSPHTGNHAGFGRSIPQLPVACSPSLVIPQSVKVPGPILAGTTIDGRPTAVPRALSHSVNVRFGIGSVMPVSYHGRQISPNGSWATHTSIAAARERED